MKNFFVTTSFVKWSGALLIAALLPLSGLAQNNGAIIQETAPAPATTATPAETPTETPAAAPAASESTPAPAATTESTPPAARPVAPTPAPAAPVARPVTVTVPAPRSVVPVILNQAPPTKRFSDGVTYIGHRYFEEKGGGWGWIKKDGDSWGSAKWVAIQEDPLRGILVPSRKMSGRSADQDYEYKLTGYFSEKVAYDPHLDETMPVFVLESYQSLGQAKPLDRKPGPPMRFTRSKRSRSSSRDDRPVPSPDGDSF